MEERRGACRALVGKPERRPLGKPRPKGGGVNIKKDFREVGCWSMDWIDLVQDRNR
jgi:hypothetical protein